MGVAARYMRWVTCGCARLPLACATPEPMGVSMKYTAPQVTVLGSVRDLTLASNKIGPDPDMYSQVVPIIGSITPIP
jgi:hypothetical protein